MLGEDFSAIKLPLSCIADSIHHMPDHLLGEVLVFYDDGASVSMDATHLKAWALDGANAVHDKVKARLQSQEAGQNTGAVTKELGNAVLVFSDICNKALDAFNNMDGEYEYNNKKTFYRINSLAKTLIDSVKDHPLKIVDALDELNRYIEYTESMIRADIFGAYDVDLYILRIAVMETLKHEIRSQMLSQDMNEQGMRKLHSASLRLNKVLSDFMKEYTNTGNWMQKMAMQKIIKENAKQNGLTPIVVAQYVELGVFDSAKSEIEKVLDHKFSCFSEFLYFFCQFFNSQLIEKGKAQAESLLQDIEFLKGAIDQNLIHAEVKNLTEKREKEASGDVLERS